MRSPDPFERIDGAGGHTGLNGGFLAGSSSPVSSIARTSSAPCVSLTVRPCGGTIPRTPQHPRGRVSPRVEGAQRRTRRRATGIDHPAHRPHQGRASARCHAFSRAARGVRRPGVVRRIPVVPARSPAMHLAARPAARQAFRVGSKDRRFRGFQARCRSTTARIAASSDAISVSDG